jgi:hypothetical protein
MLTLLENLLRWRRGRGSAPTSDLRALAGKWPDSAQWMACLATHASDAGTLGRTGAPVVAAPKCDTDRGR